MPANPSISDAEWSVMEVVWAQAPVTANRVVEALSDTHDWHPKTVRTMLNRLVKKGALTYTANGRAYEYEAAVQRDDCVRQASRSLMQRAFGGAPVSMLAYFAEHEPLTDDQIESLQKLLEDKKGGPR